MLKPKKIIQILSAFLLLAIFWVTFSLIQGLFERKISQHDLYIPKNAESVLEINSEALIKTFVQEVLLTGGLNNHIESFTKSSERQENLGIDYLSTCYVFTISENSKSLTGILVNVLDEDQFNRVMKSEEAAGTGFAAKKGVGLLLYDISGNPMSANRLNAIAARIVNTKSGFDLKQLAGRGENDQLNYWQKESTFNSGSQSFKHLKLSIEIKGKVLKMKGNANFSSSLTRQFPALKKSDLSIQSQLIPEKINDYWVSSMTEYGIKLPKISYVSGNYHYSEPSPIPELKVLPHFDGIYVFEENFQVQIPLLVLAASEKIDSLNLKSFKLGEKTIYYQQMNERTVYLGQSKYVSTTASKNTLFEISGDLKQLLEIRNGGMITRILALSPEYNATEHFLSGIKSSEFYIKNKDGKTVDLSLEIEFEEGKSALNELVSLIMDAGFID